jgi:hypothetical protein
MLGDAPGLKFKEGTLFPFIVEGLRATQRALAEEGTAINKGTQVVTLPQAATFLTLTTTPALSTDFVLPWEIEELDGGTTGRYREMTGPEHGFLPDVAPTAFLRKWTWRNGQLQFIGATRAVGIRISYEREIPVPLVLTETIPIIGGSAAIAYYAAYLHAPTGPYKENFDRAIWQLAHKEVRASQFQQVRRIPYGRR